MSKLGISVIGITIPWGDPLWANPGFEDRLGSELEQARLGHYDSAIYGNPITFIFYLSTSGLTGALKLIASRLDRLGLLSDARIFVTDAETKVWRELPKESNAPT